MGNAEEALAALLHSFQYDIPRAEICCQIGYFWKERGEYRQAAFWFQQILQLPRPVDPRGFLQEDCWGYIPCLECAVCYDHLREYTRAEQFNEKAASYKPESSAVAFNRRYFAARRVEADQDTKAAR